MPKASIAHPPKRPGQPGRKGLDYEHPNWRDLFINAYTICGNLDDAARAAFTTAMSVNARMRVEPDLAARLEDARLAYVQTVQGRLNAKQAEKGMPGVVACLATLKRHDPRWNDKMVHLNLNVNTEAPAEEGIQLLRSLVEGLQPETRLMLTQSDSGVIPPGANNAPAALVRLDDP